MFFIHEETFCIESDILIKQTLPVHSRPHISIIASKLNRTANYSNDYYSTRYQIDTFRRSTLYNERKQVHAHIRASISNKWRSEGQLHSWYGKRVYVSVLCHSLCGDDFLCLSVLWYRVSNSQFTITYACLIRQQSIHYRIVDKRAVDGVVRWQLFY